MKKCLLSIFLCMVLIFAAIPSLAAPSIEERARLKGPASDTLHELMAVWGIDQQGGQYPDDVAGLYITDNYKAAVVLVRGATTARKNEIRSLVTKPEVILFKSAKYSHNELTAIADKVDSDGSFELLSRWVGDYETENAVMVEVYYGGKEAARAYFKKYGDKVKVIEAERDTLPIGEPDAASKNESWLEHNFPKLRSMETTQTRFVFASAPKVTKTRAVLNRKGESLTLYRFETEKDVLKANAMIKSTTLGYGGKTVYVDTLFPATYYVHPEGKAIALYCGSDKAVNEKLQKTYAVAGDFGGYFDARHGITAPDGTIIAAPQTEDINLKTIKERADSIYIATVTRTPSWKGHSVNGSYALDVENTVRGIERTTLKLSDLWPGVMIEGRSYVVCVKHVATENGKTTLLLADRLYKSVFEINDKGYILPIRDYGMKAPVKLDTFLKSI